ncbi:MAG: adenine phosphoribosyltransferase [Candidatus Lokiarchaeota archaeon]|nr:adenine phosphoribosyltransferase [Candidatus Lokiarchaeota archaeon]MBD3199775.1 adenine phosphoribosyltransferase [Candidatus Lokiarchaeota archaeon]
MVIRNMNEDINLLDYIRNVPDWPKKGIQFKDITTLCQDPLAFKVAVDRIVEHYMDKGITKVAAIEARGYVFGGVIAYLLNAGFVLIRKKGKLPWQCYEAVYELEYGTDSIEMHTDAVEKGEKVLLFDDLLATGGTAKAAASLIEKSGADVAGVCFVIELTGSLHGRDQLTDYDILSLIEIPVEE